MVPGAELRLEFFDRSEGDPAVELFFVRPVAPLDLPVALGPTSWPPATASRISFRLRVPPWYPRFPEISLTVRGRTTAIYYI